MSNVRVGAVVFIASFFSLVSSYVLNGVMSPSGNPGVERPVVSADVFAYTFEAFAFLLVAIGVTAVVGATPAVRHWLSSHLAIAFAWITALSFTFVTLGRQQQVDVFNAGRADLLLDGRLAGWEGFYSVGFLFFGASMVLFAYALLRTQLVPRAVSAAGVVLGIPTAVAGYLRLVLGRQTVSDEYTMTFAFLMLWLVVLGAVLYNRASRLARPAEDPAAS